jgi:hypothetical protein
LTRSGGLLLFQPCCKSLKLRHALQLAVRWPAYAPKTYHPVDLFLAHVMAIVAGLGRIENTQSLLHNGLIPPLLGLPDFPHRDTLRTFLWRFGPASWQRLQAMHTTFRTALFQRLDLRDDGVVDADTTALITYGPQERVARGDIPTRRHHQGSYAPILSTGLSLGAELRAGNVHASTNAWPFLIRQLAPRPSTVAASRTRVRLDGAFYDQAMTRPLDEQRVGSVLVAHIRPP